MSERQPAVNNRLCVTRYYWLRRLVQPVNAFGFSTNSFGLRFGIPKIMLLSGTDKPLNAEVALVTRSQLPECPLPMRFIQANQRRDHLKANDASSGKILPAACSELNRGEIGTTGVHVRSE